jgi:phosphoadenosine phosphosulfate reductase
VSVASADFGAPPARPPAWFPATAARLAGAPAESLLSWAVATFGSGLTVACSMQDAVLVDLAVRVDPRVEVVFLDTGFHFDETLATARLVQTRYDLNLVTLRPLAGAGTYNRAGAEACCAARKVAPLERHLAQRAAWVTGLRRAEASTRTVAAPLEWDAARGMVKVNPIVSWTDDDVARYIADHDIIVNPLRRKGFDSIGCAPCTVPGRGRTGRWAGSDRLECGLHVVGSGG